MKLGKLAASFLTVSLIAACGGGGGGSGSANTTSISGVAFDGYLFDALACLDLDNNLICDAGDPSAYTDINGKFTLTNVTPEQIAAHSIVVMAIADRTMDSDKPNQKIAKSYILTAPAGQTVISPATTLLKAFMHSTGNNADVSARLMELTFDNYQNTPYPWLNAITKDAQSRMNIGDLTKNYMESGDSVMQKLGWTLKTLLEEVNTTTFYNDFTKNFTEFVAPNIGDILQASNVDEVAQRIQVISFNKLARKNGVHDFRHLGGNWFNFRSTTLSDKLFTFTNFSAINQPNFVSQPDPERDYWELTNSVWTPVSRTISLGALPENLIGGPYGNSGVNVAVESLSLSGKSYDFSAMNRPGVSHTFPAGSQGFKLSHTSPVHRYILTSPRLAGPLQEELTTLSGLVAAYASSAQANYVNFVRSRTGLLITFTPTAANAGTLQFRHPDFVNQVLISGGTYSIETVNGQQMLFISGIPEAALSAVAKDNPTGLNDYRNGIRPFFAVIPGPNGGIFEGVYTPPGTIANPTVQYNRAALNSILKALSLCQLSEEFTNDCPR
jgi:hypothetical protein